MFMISSQIGGFKTNNKEFRSRILQKIVGNGTVSTCSAYLWVHR